MRNEENISQYSTTNRVITTFIVILLLYFVMTTLSIGDPIKIRIHQSVFGKTLLT